MAKSPKTKSEPETDPLTARLQQQRTSLIAQIDTCEKAIESAILESGTRVLGARGNPRVEDSALQPVVLLEAKAKVLKAALVELDRKIACAPQRAAEFEAAIAPLEPAIAKRDRILAEATKMLRDLHAKLLDLRASNSEAVMLLGASYKAWGRIGRPPELEPRFTPVAFPADLHTAFFRDTPFIGSVSLRGDSSQPVLRMRASAFDGDEAEAWALADPETGRPYGL